MFDILFMYEMSMACFLVLMLIADNSFDAVPTFPTCAFSIVSELIKWLCQSEEAQTLIGIFFTF